MLLGAYYAGAAIEQSMLGATHACANPLTARYGTPHGVAIAVMLPRVVRWNAAVVGERYRELMWTAGVDAGTHPATLGGAAQQRIQSRRPAGFARRLSTCPKSDLPGARGRRGRAVDRHIQSEAVRCGGGAHLELY